MYEKASLDWLVYSRVAWQSIFPLVATEQHHMTTQVIATSKTAMSVEVDLVKEKQVINIPSRDHVPIIPTAA